MGRALRVCFFFSVEVMRAGNPRFQFPLGYYPPVATTNPDPSIDEPQTSVEQSWDPAGERRHGGSSSYQKETTPLKSSLLTAGHRFCWDPAWICFPPFQRGGGVALPRISRSIWMSLVAVKVSPASFCHAIIEYGFCLCFARDISQMLP